MSNGIIEDAYINLMNRAAQRRGFVTLDDILIYTKLLQHNEYHAHICIQGPNGVGKSYMMLMLMKAYNGKDISQQKIIYSHHSTADLIETIAKSNNDVIGIDEAKAQMFYLDFQQTENKELIRYIEYAREHKNAFVVCTKDVKQLDNKYRDGQVQILIWIFDRLKAPIRMKIDDEERDYVAYAGVFAAHPTLVKPDKFALGLFSDVYTLSGIKYIAENYSPTFVGYMMIPHTKYYLTADEIEDYKKMKEEGIIREKENIGIKIAKKLKLSENPLKYDLNKEYATVLKPISEQERYLRLYRNAQMKIMQQIFQKGFYPEVVPEKFTYDYCKEKNQLWNLPVELLEELKRTEEKYKNALSKQVS